MKKTILLLSLLTMSIGSFAQKAALIKGALQTAKKPTISNSSNSLAKTTADTTVGAAAIDLNAIRVYSYPNDTGFASGTNAFGDKGFAQRYDVNGQDSTVQVLGMFAGFLGTVNPATTNTATFSCWGIAAPINPFPSDLNIFYSGLPGTSLAQSSPVSFANLGINDTSVSILPFFFNSATAAQGGSFFVGCELAYTPLALNGDSVAVVTDTDGSRTAFSYGVSGTDTIINNWTAIESSSNTWDDEFYNVGLYNDYCFIPILTITQNNVGVTSVTKNNLTWYGNYPNPANDYTNIKFSLGTTANVTVTIMDMNGRKLDVVTQSNLTSGTHEINYNTSKLAAGNYLYTIRTSNRDAMASKLTVVR